MTKSNLREKSIELEQSQQFIFSVLSAMSDVLLVCNERGVIEETNAPLCELVGRSDADLRGTSFYDLLAGTLSVERARTVLDNTNPPRRSEGLELNLLDAQRQSVSVDTNCTSRVTASGHRVGAVFVARSTAEIKRAYLALRTAHEELKRTQQQLLHSEKMASLGRLDVAVAHEAINPISFVLGNVHALSRYSNRFRRYLAAVHAGDPPEQLEELRGRLRIEQLLDDLPSLIEGTLEGAQRTADIVNGLNRFSANNVNSPPASSCGRLFDAVAAAAGVCRERALYEDQAAIEFETLVDQHTLQDEADTSAYTFSIAQIDANQLPRIESLPMWLALLGDLASGAAAPVIAVRFHKGLAIAIVQMVEKLRRETSRNKPITVVALSGGVFQNRVLLEQVVKRLEPLGLRVLTAACLATSDGGLALGQSVVAAARRSAAY